MVFCMSKFKAVKEYGCLEAKSGVMDDELNVLSVYATVRMLNELFEENKRLHERIISLHQEYGQIHSEICEQNNELKTKINRLTNKIDKKHN